MNDDKDKKTSLVDEAKAIRDEILKAKEELKAENDRKEKLQAEGLMSSNAGIHVEKPKMTEEQKIKEGAKEFWKGTGIEKSIEKYG